MNYYRSIIFFILCLFSLFSAGQGFAQQVDTYDIRSYGAAGDGRTLNTTAIRRVIALASRNSGGRVFILATARN